MFSGIPSYSPYPGMIRPAFAPRPPGPIGVLPAISRPPLPVVPGVRPIIPPIVRPALVPITPAEKPQTTVYVGKIAPSVENDYMLSLLQLCGPVKSWKRAQDPSNGAPKGFGFCEFESAEGVLRALRLLSKLNIDGQELVLNVNQATREYLERYVEKKRENAKKLNESEAATVAEKEGDGASSAEKNESLEPSGDDSKKDDSKNNDSNSGKKESHDNAPFGIVTDEDREADKEASQKLTSMLEERLKTRPLPPPPPHVPADVLAITGSEAPTKSDSDADPSKNDAEDRNDEETNSDNKATSEHDKTEINSPDRNRRYDRRSREHDRERDVKREKEREVERYEREAERERIRKEREQRRKIEEAEREYEERLKDWEYREREKEKQRQYDRERDKERERKRKKEIIYDEEDEEEDSRKRWHRSVLEEKRKKRLREKEDDLADRRKEEEEIAEAKKRAEEEKKQQLQQQREALKLLNGDIASRHEKSAQAEESTGDIVQHGVGGIAGHEYPAGDGISRIGVGDNSVITMAASDVQQNNNAPAKKLGFGLVGSGKRTAVPSVFYEEDDDERNKEKKMRPLVPIDYSTEEMQAIQTPPGQSQPNLAAAAEFAKQLSTANMKEEKPESERERSRRSHDRSSQREKDRSSLDGNRVKDENRDKILERVREREHGQEKLKTTDNKKLLDAKQLIDMIPRTKEDLFSYEINWALYDQHELHERMRPWISKKIMEFLGEEETSLVDYIVTSTREHVKATEMLETLKSILDEEAEMFVLKMWRMLIFEIKKVETGLHLRSRS
ncbi:RNA-binding motif protein 25 isoform X2 [Syzygium oleosum]|uniref:RNA-binding motif protein 25 isoform X2 n=1 Tax=Syzygium oleosum TaxID=219896 RepID=UPI0011D232F2|nr:RNA-binding motif protein 25 isoform X2 [Syzygium oleosum]XP_030449275.1 RNA-binding motif protein 25 isoform X2 [Syzygium oleosum]XP_030449276.1 RNA-binding motif protein 25 isoform X2 [Syzygium oleosum]